MNRLSILWFMAVCVSAMGFATPVIKTADYYQAITYNWTDANGQVHENVPITEPATNTEQITELLRTIYMNRDVPGNMWGYSDGQQGPIYYNPYMASNGKATPSDDSYMPYWDLGTCSSNVPEEAAVEQQFPPHEEGITLLLVTVKNTWDYYNEYNLVPPVYHYGNANGGTEYEGRTKLSNGKYRETRSDYKNINEAIQSVQLITQAIRVNDTNAQSGSSNRGGVLYKLNGTFDRFFFMAKGKARSRHYSTPFHRMFEQFGPSRSDELTPTFYETLTNGNIYEAAHDCSSCVNLMHFYSMHGAEAQQAEEMKNLCLYIPDCRFADNDDPSDPYSDYNEDYRPSLSFYSVFLNANRSEGIVKVENGENFYEVTLDWTTTIDKLCPGNDVEEEFYIYKVVNGVVESTPLAGPIYDHTYSYLEVQEEKGREITYVITARPRTNEQSSFESVLSNYASVIIPGFDDLERLVINIDRNYRSEYDMESEVNNYQNLIVTKNNADAAEAIRAHHLKTGAEFELVRLGDGGNTPDTHVATVTITDRTLNASAGVWVFSYHITYNNPVSGVSYPAADGTFVSLGAEENSIVDFGDAGLRVLDAFSASTSLNDHPSRYDYQMYLRHTGVDIVDKDNNIVEVVYSNVVNVPVFKTTTDLQPFSLTQDEVEGDTRHTLEGDNRISMDVLVQNNRTIHNYYMTRNATGNYVSRAQNTFTGMYSTYTTADGSPAIDSKLDDYTFPDGGNEVTVTLVDNGTAELTAQYVGVIETVFVDDNDQVYFNTYGSDIKTAPNVNLQATATPQSKSSDTFDLNGTEGCYYKALVSVTAEMPTGLTPVKVRVWRNVDDADRMEVADQYLWRLDSLNATFDGMPGQNTRDGLASHGSVQESGNRTVLTLDLSDVFGARIATEESPVPVTYQVRIYCVDENGTTYTMRYCYADTQFAETVMTAVTEASWNRQVQQVRYVNTTGQFSDRPFKGLNLVVTRYSDGHVDVSKQIMNP